MTPRRFEGRRALVTGGGRGIGAGIARRLAAEGADVVIASRTLAPAEELAAEIGARAVEVDVADPEAAHAAVTATGALDVLVNNAAFDDFDYFTNITPERWRAMLATNLEGLFACTRAALPAMQDARYGRIVNIGSEAGRIGSVGNAVYAATKGAVTSFTKSIARENARYGITANCIAAGPVETPMLQRNREIPEVGEKIVAGMEAATLVKRLGTPAEIGAAVAYLASEEAAFVTGETLGVSGGMGSAVPDVLISDDGGVRRLELNRPDSLNAWTPDMGRELLDAVREAADDHTVRCVLIAGAGRAFCAGADVKVPREMTPEGTADLRTRLEEIYNPIVVTLHEMPKPAVAAVHGAAAGLGFSLAMACDLIVAAEDATFLLAFVHLGVMPDGGVLGQLIDRAGRARAMELAMLGRKLPASEALAWGLVNEVVPVVDLRERAAEVAARLAASPTTALASMKELAAAAPTAGLEDQLALEARLQQRHATTADYAEGVAAFTDKRAPRFSGR